ncbi:trehalose-6-phosphate synthase [Gordonia sp. (in: high G+C Gram-positive bacteria)]|uniref:alpha,alpha-trehalose-phosphate synthase (UDP-forming) n=1 Tax=Gordonia sp. (in: high G+C Gram-positive bacteria) TaxID=84139 RepID=UPI0016992C06|nr:trehalose-6-phosphate synthase [Gordonia sp. (in: high G+C Gram-positive bacteria)]NLG45000.1 trehalose-6-phosphate synthase [Gordonia sp. (in: high G+C Gram-positive bacteria)]
MTAPDGHPAAGANFVVVANRLPVDKRVEPDGTTVWKRAPGGLVTALTPTFASRTGAWVGWSGIPDSAENPPVDGIDIHAVPLSHDEIADYYEGFSNATLWPLYHDVLVKPEYRHDWWDTYVTVNRRFAEETSRAAAPGATVWVHDYQLQLVPAMLRDLRPDLRIGFFLHIPFPPRELFSQLPWRREILEGLLGADLIGFHLPGGAENFLSLARRILGVEVSTDPVGVRDRFGTVAYDGRTVQVGSFPISIDSANVAANAARMADRAAEIRAELGDPEVLLLGVDRLDYTKGIDVRLAGLERLFAAGRLDPATTVLVQLASPSRERVDSYIEMRNRIEQTVGHINGTYGTAARPPIRYLLQPVPRDELLAYFRAADVCLVTPMRDGMNLVAKEYLASRDDLGGALVLSEFTGAAAELTEAYQLNPYDDRSVDDAIAAAATDPVEERRERMTALHEQVMTNDVDQWAHAFLDALAADR